MSLTNPENKIRTTMRLVESNENLNIRLNANGGNSILIICEPLKEGAFISKIKNLMPDDKYEIIDLNRLLIKFVKDNKRDLDEVFDLLQGSVHQIFKSPYGEEGADLFGLIIDEISSSLQDKKIPVLINTGSLYGSGIENLHVMENPLVMKASLPLLVLYPATKENDKLLFLGKRPASKYRCMIIE